MAVSVESWWSTACSHCLKISSYDWWKSHCPSIDPDWGHGSQAHILLKYILSDSHYWSPPVNCGDSQCQCHGIRSHMVASLTIHRTEHNIREACAAGLDNIQALLRSQKKTNLFSAQVELAHPKNQQIRKRIWAKVLIHLYIPITHWHTCHSVPGMHWEMFLMLLCTRGPHVLDSAEIWYLRP